MCMVLHYETFLLQIDYKDRYLPLSSYTLEKIKIKYDSLVSKSQKIYEFWLPELKTGPDLFKFNILATLHLFEVVVPEWDEVVVVGEGDHPFALLLSQQ